ncbi:MAG: T9SS type A sorting domain-containing protein [Candidatus Eisenbacteria bacterium]
MRNHREWVCLCGGLQLLVLLWPRPVAASWPSDPLVNVPLCTATGEQYFPAIVADGSGGAIVTWWDMRSGSGDIYAQRISASGAPLWGANGVALCTASGDQSNPAIVSDGAGGATVVWSDLRGGLKYDIYVQRISATGTPMWTTDGVALCTAGGNQQSPVVTTDGAGGAIVAWFGQFAGHYDIYAQRISATGTPMWTINGVALCAAAGDQESPTIIPDDAGGAIVSWFDQRSGSDYTFADIYAQRISSSGAPMWTPEGVALCTATGSQQNPNIAPDGAHGAIVTWFDGRNGNYDIYAQRVSDAGAVQWAADGVALCTAAGEQAMPTLVPDGTGGAIVTWRDYRSGSEYDAYAQRISGSGSPQWAANGVAVCTATGDQYDPRITSDGAGGAIVAWPDLRNGSDLDVYAQRLSPGGAPQWTDEGVTLCTAAGYQNVVTPVSDGAGGAIATWGDHRGGGDYDIYAQRVQANGVLGGDVTSVPGGGTRELVLAPVTPNPTHRGRLMVRFTLPSGSPALLELFDVSGRRIAARQVGSLGAGVHSLDLAESRDLAPGLYLVRLRQGSHALVTRVAMLE